MDSMVPIITYHALGDVASPLFTSISVFEAQLEALSTAGYQTVSLAAVVGWLKGGPPLPPQSIVLTFDDGYLSVFNEARPRLVAHGFTATVFLISDYCGRDNQWPGQPGSVPKLPLVDWSQATELAEDGFELGAHTKTHPPLPHLEPAQIEEEAQASKTAIQAHTGQAVSVFAQPYGASNDTVDAIVRRHFEGAAGTRLGIVRPGHDPYALPRIDAYYMHPGLIARMHTRPFRYYLRLRQGLRSLRRRLRPDWQPGKLTSS